ncbi:MAG: hypothetical protein L0Y43_07230, partial [Methylococcaceae bacterium]|nr:hypothetical protein [Methylococcaceae bacterium]
MRVRTERKRIRSVLGLFMVCVSVIVPGRAAFAQDSVGAVMGRMKSDSAVRIAYRETRYLELFEKPVESSGMFYGMPPD